LVGYFWNCYCFFYLEHYIKKNNIKLQIKNVLPLHKTSKKYVQLFSDCTLGSKRWFENIIVIKIWHLIINNNKGKIYNSNVICLYRRIWLVTIIRKILNLQVVTKGFSSKDPPSWKREILHVIFTTIVNT
jgi:hypothetical protein